MQSASDIFLGWTKDDNGRDFYIRQYRDAKVKPALEDMNFKTFLTYAHSCGWALARAHARTGNPAIISGYIGESEKLEDVFSKFAYNYNDQNEKDYETMNLAMKKGKLTG